MATFALVSFVVIWFTRKAWITPIARKLAFTRGANLPLLLAVVGIIILCSMGPPQ